MESLDTRVWPERLLQLAQALEDPRNTSARGEFWLLLNLALAQRLRMHSRRFGGIEADRIHDLASQKALDLIGKLDCGHWKPLESSPGELVNFLSTIARNALVDELRREGRAALNPGAAIDSLPHTHEGHRDATSHAAVRRAFVSHLASCAEKLNARDRVVWLLRVLYEMSSKNIAGHPEVLLKPDHIDVILKRCRAEIRACMGARGLDVHELPPGTFAELWMKFRATPLSPETAHD